ncbi:MAG: hypothetical protein R2838_08725 [Caldilineaceae bacterium]
MKVAVDSTATLDGLSAAAETKGVRIGVVLELNTGMGARGPAGRTALELGQGGAQLPRPRTARADDVGRPHHRHHARSRQARRDARSMGQLLESVDLCRQAGCPWRSSVAAAAAPSPSPRTPRASPKFRRAASSSTTSSTHASTCPPALRSLSTVVTSRPAPDRVIVDGGFKTHAPLSNPPKPIGMDGVADVVCSAEHGIITLDHADDTIAVGDRFDFIPGYGDHTVFLHDQIYALRNDVVEAVWEVEREEVAVGRDKIED